MEKPVILTIQDMKKELFGVVNKYSDEIPAIIILDTVNDIKNQLEANNRKQLEQAKQQYEESLTEESEGVENERRQADNRTDSDK
jgi:hypothetical protein